MTLFIFAKPLYCPIFWFSLLFWVFCLCSPAQSGEFTFFPNTQYPLRVHFLEGKKPGPTVMVQGGIQGDEVSGFISAQILTEATLKKGRLIVVPRANIPSIMARSRQINVDLNRRFDHDYDQYYEDRLARCIRFLISKADAFIHLHEGSGFYSSHHQNDLRGPHCYGQSIIIDQKTCCQNFELQNFIHQVLDPFNSDLPKEYRFSVFNTRTGAGDSEHPEQRKSLSFYAVNTLHIPALAIEMSKNIKDLEWKVAVQTRLTLAFLRSLGLEVTLDRKALERITGWFNTPDSIVLNGRPAKKKLTLPLGGILQPEADSTQKAVGIFASDRPRQNLARRARHILFPFDHLQVVQDGVPISRIPVQWTAKNTTTHTNAPLWAFSLNGHFRIVENNTTISAYAGDTLVIEGLWGRGEEEILNVKGYVSAIQGENDGQDLGAEILLNKGDFLDHYLECDGDQWTFEVNRETPGQDPARIRFVVKPRTVRAVSIAREGKSYFLHPESKPRSLNLPAGRYVLEDIWTQGGKDQVLALINDTPIHFAQPFELKPGIHVLDIYGHNDFMQLASFDLEVQAAQEHAVR